MVGKILGLKRDELKGEWRSLHNEELRDLYSPNIIRLIKTRRARLGVGGGGNGGGQAGFWWGNLNIRDHLE